MLSALEGTYRFLSRRRQRATKENMREKKTSTVFAQIKEMRVPTTLLSLSTRPPTIIRNLIDRKLAIKITKPDRKGERDAHIVERTHALLTSNSKDPHDFDFFSFFICFVFLLFLFVLVVFFDSAKFNLFLIGEFWNTHA